jgi:cardiolipin synthase
MWIAIFSAFVTLILVIVALNFTTSEKKIEKKLPRLYSVHDEQFDRSLSVLLGPPIVDGNTVKALRNGDEIFPPMLAAIRGATKTINFETYIYWSGAIGKEFADALSERARAGVKIERYHPLHWYNLARMNNRTHRKLLVVDGTIGFTGGVGIAEQWTGHAQDPEHWRDTHFRVEGPVVAQMQAVFLDNWIKVTGEVQHGPHSFPPLAASGSTKAQMFSSSPSGGGESMQLMYLMAVTAAQRSILVSASYFVPDELTLRALIEARRRGVDVQIIVPGATTMDVDLVQHASRAQWGSLLEAGAKIFTYDPTMYHCKVMIVDTRLVSVGSTNFDERSFRLNDEANLNIIDERFAAEQEKYFAEDRARAHEVTLAEWQARPWTERMKERFASLFRSQL